MTARVIFRRPDDYHFHARQDEMMRLQMRFIAAQFHNVLYMPNLVPALTTADSVVAYERGLREENPYKQGHYLMVLYLTKDTTAEQIVAAHAAGVRIVKYYPDGGTTNSGSGLRTPRDISPAVLQAMENLDMVLCIHGEVVASEQPDPTRREHDFIPYLSWLIRQHPNLRIVVEHVSSQRMFMDVMDFKSDKVAMTITAHHPFLTTTDAQHDPHCNCMPIAKTPQDRDYLAQIILYGFPRVFYGSDSAPHPVERKLATPPAAGVWSAGTGIPVLWDHFDRRGGPDKWKNFEKFMFRSGAEFYGLTEPDENRKPLTLKRERWLVPDIFEGVVPFKAGEVLDWRVEGMEWFGEPYED